MELTEGQTAVVTGAASGMGRAFAERFGELGLNVVLADVEEPRLVEAAAQMRESGAKVLEVVTDVASGESIDALAAKAFDTFGSVNVLCRLFVYLCFEDQWHRAKLLDHRDRRTDGKTGDDCRKHD